MLEHDSLKISSWRWTHPWLKSWHLYLVHELSRIFPLNREMIEIAMQVYSLYSYTSCVVSCRHTTFAHGLATETLKCSNSIFTQYGSISWKSICTSVRQFGPLIHQTKQKMLNSTQNELESINYFLFMRGQGRSLDRGGTFICLFLGKSKYSTTLSL